MYSRNERTDIVTSIGVGIRSTTVKPLRLSERTLEKLLAVITYSEIPSVESREFDQLDLFGATIGTIHVAAIRAMSLFP